MDVIVVGSCMTDLISYASHLPKEGETLTGYRFTVGFGGKGANQCITAAHLGAKVAMVGKLGEDTFGQEYMKNMQTNNVNCDHLKIIPGESNGVASILVGDNGANCIVIVPGANNRMSVEDVNKAEDLMKDTKVLICQNEIPQDISLSAIKLAKKHNVTVIYNPAPASSTLKDELFSLPDYFCPNETEAEILTGKRVSSVEDAKEACQVLQDSKGCRSVIITLGDKGAVFKEAPSKEAQHIPISPVKAVDTTGAGDSFVGSLAYFLARNRDLPVPEMIRRACQIASMSVLKPGTQTSFPKAKDLPSELMA